MLAQGPWFPNALMSLFCFHVSRNTHLPQRSGHSVPGKAELAGDSASCGQVPASFTLQQAPPGTFPGDVWQSSCPYRLLEGQSIETLSL